MSISQADIDQLRRGVLASLHEHWRFYLIEGNWTARGDQPDVWRRCHGRNGITGTQDRANYFYRNLTLASDNGEGGSVDELTLKKRDAV